MSEGVFAVPDCDHFQDPKAENGDESVVRKCKSFTHVYSIDCQNISSTSLQDSTSAKATQDQCTESWIKALESELKCVVCLGIYREPKILACGHSICRKCIQPPQILKLAESKVTCPLKCSRVTKLESSEGTNATLLTASHLLPDNVSLKKILTILNYHQQQQSTTTTTLSASRTSHHDVEEKVVEKEPSNADQVERQYCVYCSAGLCENHMEEHERSFHPSKIIAQQKSSTLQEILLDVANYPTHCPIHLTSDNEPQVFKLWCLDCEVVVCTDCAWEPMHAKHDVQLLSSNKETIESRFEKTREELDELLKKDEEKLKAILIKNVERSNRHIEKVKTDCNKAKQQAKEFYQNLASIIEKRKNQILSQVEVERERQTKSIFEKTESLEKAAQILRKFNTQIVAMNEEVPCLLQTAHIIRPLSEIGKAIENWKAITGKDIGVKFWKGYEYGMGCFPENPTKLNEMSGRLLNKGSVRYILVDWPPKSCEKNDPCQSTIYNTGDEIPFKMHYLNYRNVPIMQGDSNNKNLKVLMYIGRSTIGQVNEKGVYDVKWKPETMHSSEILLELNHSNKSDAIGSDSATGDKQLPIQRAIFSMNCNDMDVIRPIRLPRKNIIRFEEYESTEDEDEDSDGWEDADSDAVEEVRIVDIMSSDGSVTPSSHSDED